MTLKIGINLNAIKILVDEKRLLQLATARKKKTYLTFLIISLIQKVKKKALISSSWVLKFLVSHSYSYTLEYLQSSDAI